MSAEYYVHSADGQTYGPAGMDMLQRWAQEGRIVSETTLTERDTARVLRAGDLAGLSIPRQATPAYAPTQVPPVEGYPRSEARIDTAWPLAKAVLTLVLCCLPLGVVATIYAAQASSQVASGNAELGRESIRKAHVWANWSIASGLVVSCLYLAFMIATLAFG